MRERKWQVVKDLQGGEFGMDRVLTAKEWGETAYSWADSDDWDDPSECLLENHESEEELIEWIADMWELKFREVIVELTEEEKKAVFKGLNCGDIWGLIILKDIIDKNYKSMDYHEVHCLLNSVMDLNAMNDLQENGNTIHEKYGTRINELYIDLKNELFDACGIMNEDYYKYKEV